MVKKIEYYFKVALHYLKELLLFDSFYLNNSYSQEGEDIVVDRILGHKENGFYVDIGAHHPKRLSNTYRFYKRGWSGINIDAMPGSMKKFSFIRSRDINLECAITRDVNPINYYVFNETALNTFSRENAILWSNKPPYRIVNTIQVKGDRLDNILSRYLNHEYAIDFMSIDVEGYELDVLLTNNWETFRPRVVIIEVQCVKLYDAVESDSIRFLQENGYTIVAKLYYSIILCDNKFYK